MNSVERWSLLNKAKKKNPRGPALWKFNNSLLTEEYNSAKICELYPKRVYPDLIYIEYTSCKHASKVDCDVNQE